MDMHIPHCQYHKCWCPWVTRSHEINNHVIDYVEPVQFGACTSRIRYKNYKNKYPFYKGWIGDITSAEPMNLHTYWYTNSDQFYVMVCCIFCTKPLIKPIYHVWFSWACSRRPTFNDKSWNCIWAHIHIYRYTRTYFFHVHVPAVTWIQAHVVCIYIYLYIYINIYVL